MSSLRNAVKRITHKERSQPVQRQHLGILEKKKDYKKRAVDYHNKEDKVKMMKTKAANRNPDEFYFGMNNSQIQEGKHRSTRRDGTRDLPPDIIALMKNQDLSYIRMKKQSDRKKADRLQASLHLVDTTTGDDTTTSRVMKNNKNKNKNGNKRKHTVFVNSTEEAESFHVATHFETLPEFAGRSFNRLRTKDIKEIATKKASRGRICNGNNKDSSDDDHDFDEEYEPTRHELHMQAVNERKNAKKLAKERNVSYREMEARVQRVQEMQNAEDHLLMEKKVAGKGRKRKIKEAEGGRPAQYKWRRKRLR